MIPIRCSARRVLATSAVSALLAIQVLQGEQDKPAVPAPLPPVTILFVRHAETAADTRTGADPELSAAGAVRARALDHLLQKSAVTHLFATEYRRTQATLAPLAKRTGLKTTVLPARAVERQLAALRALPAGSVAVVAGHSNTVPQMVAALGVRVAGLTKSGTIEHSTYQRAFLLTRAKGIAPKLLELTVGQAAGR
ncbi:MAG: histidine phosphatase family protein [Planctomycetes bacterium]|nr:histidine phosphatase family protein [Planctomycetota bacterium]